MEAIHGTIHFPGSYIRGAILHELVIALEGISNLKLQDIGGIPGTDKPTVQQLN